VTSEKFKAIAPQILLLVRAVLALVVVFGVTLTAPQIGAIALVFELLVGLPVTWFSAKTPSPLPPPPVADA
jgi:hypothetical protein